MDKPLDVFWILKLLADLQVYMVTKKFRELLEETKNSITMTSVKTSKLELDMEK